MLHPPKNINLFSRNSITFLELVIQFHKNKYSFFGTKNSLGDQRIKKCDAINKEYRNKRINNMNVKLTNARKANCGIRVYHL